MGTLYTLYTGCHCPVTAGQKGGGFGKWTSVTPRGRKPISPHPSGENAGGQILSKPKSMLDPLKRLFCLGKFLDLESGNISTAHFALAKSVVSWLCFGVTRSNVLFLQSFLGSLQWVLQPTSGLGPRSGGPLAWTLWGPAKCNGVPKGVLESLAQVLGHALLPLSKTNCPLIPTLGIDLRSLQNLTSIKTNTVKHEANGIFVSLGVHYFPLYQPPPFPQRWWYLCPVYSGCIP